MEWSHWPSGMEHHECDEPNANHQKACDYHDIRLAPEGADRPPKKHRNPPKRDAQHEHHHGIFFRAQECEHVLRRAVWSSYYLEEDPLRERKAADRTHDALSRQGGAYHVL